MAKNSFRRCLAAILTLTCIASGCAPRSAPADGDLDCAEDETWFEQGSVLPNTVGSSTPEEAAVQALGRFRDRVGGEITVVSDSHASVVVDGHELVVALISEAPAGGWIVLTVTGCGPYEG